MLCKLWHALYKIHSKTSIVTQEENKEYICVWNDQGPSLNQVCVTYVNKMLLTY